MNLINEPLFSSARRGLLSLILLLGSVWTGFASADGRPLDAPRAQGLVGERFDGYAVIRDTSASADIKALIDSVNAERRQLYAQKAKEQKAPEVEVGKVYAIQIKEKAPTGTWIQNMDGTWTKK